MLKRFVHDAAGVTIEPAFFAYLENAETAHLVKTMKNG
jgi:hypothetical protein